MKSKAKFILITLGEELLLGLTRNGHLTFIGEQLRRRGVTLHSNFTISDDSLDIEEQFRYCWEKADVVITTGGLGPTVDDRTKECIAEVTEDELILDEKILDTIQLRFDSMGRKMTANNRKQAYRPASAEVLENPNGTAPGLWMEKEGKTLVMLPGPPSELQPMFIDKVLPRLQEKNLIQDSENFIQLRTIGIGESALETKLQPLFKKHAKLEVAYCAHQGQVDCRISFSNAEDCQDELLELANECRERLGDRFLCFGHDSLTKVICDIMKARNRTLALAEDQTSGYLANELSKVEGFSEIFLGSVVAPGVDAKVDLLSVPEEMLKQHTQFSAEIAMAMAAGAAEKFEADYSLSITGATKGVDGSVTLFSGLHSPNGVLAKEISFKNAPKEISSRVFNVVFDWLRQELLKEAYQAGKSKDGGLRKESDNILRSLS